MALRTLEAMQEKETLASGVGEPSQMGAFPRPGKPEAGG